MIVILKKQYKDDVLITTLNEALVKQFGAKHSTVFNTQKFIQEEADFFNTDPGGLKQIPDFERPVTSGTLEDNFFWFRVGEFHFKLSGGGEADEAINAVAVCKWVTATKAKYIEKEESDNYGKKVVSQYLDPIFEEAGFDLRTIWKI